MQTPRLLALALATCVAVLATSCGGGAEALSKPEFLEQANAVCQASRDEADPIFEAIWADFDDDTDWNDSAVQELIFTRLDEAMTTLKPIFDRQLDDIRELVPPDEDQALIAELLDDQEAALDEFAQLIDAAAAGDEAARAAMDNDEDPFSDVDARARAYGLTVCADEST